MSIEFVGNEYDLARIVKPSRDVTFYTDRIHVKQDERFKIYLQQEPAEINNSILEVKHYWKDFDVILTYNDHVLKVCPNARFFYFQTVTWILPDDYNNIDTSIKEFQISNLTGFKAMCPAHVFRHLIYINQGLFDKNLFVFYRSSAGPIIPAIGNNPILGSTEGAKIELFRRFQFSLVIENTRERHCYTEKLIDCLLTKTIPIYYGCENIQDYFDTTGWILIENQSLEEIIEKCKCLHKDYYSMYTSTIEKNYDKARIKLDNYKQLNDVLVTIPGYKDSEISISR